MKHKSVHVIFISVDDDGPPTLATHTSHLQRMAERDARAMEAAQRAMEEATKRMEEASRAAAANQREREQREHKEREREREREREQREREMNDRENKDPQHPPPMKSPTDEPPLKRLAMEEERLMPHLAMPSAHLKITSRGPYINSKFSCPADNIL